MSTSFRFLCAATLVLSTAPIHAAVSKNAFIKGWEDHPVTLKRALYNLVYNERPRFMPLVKRNGRTIGLTVATPTDTYYRFASQREYEDDVVDRDPARVLELLKDRYRRSAHLDTDNVQEIEAVMLVRFEPGVQLKVQRVSIEDDEVRVLLRRPGDDLTTTLTVKWAAPFSRELVESALIDNVLNRYLARQ